MDHFRSGPEVGGVGGRDRCLVDGTWDDRREAIVAKLQWFGRTIGNTEVGYGEAREVDFLKGANMSYRMESIGAIQFDCRLRGSGAQPPEDRAFSMAVRRTGAKLIYDPLILVDHYEGPREEQRHYAAMLPVNDAGAFSDLSFNWVVAVWDEFSVPRHLVFLLWNLLIGTRVSPGLAQAVRFTPQLGLASWRRFWLTQMGTTKGYFTLMGQGRSASDATVREGLADSTARASANGR
jgi:hypothetical protein